MFYWHSPEVAQLNIGRLPIVQNAGVFISETEASSGMDSEWFLPLGQESSRSHRLSIGQFVLEFQRSIVLPVSVS